MTTKEQSHEINSYPSRVVSHIEVRLSLQDKTFQREFDQFIDSELICVIDRLGLKLGRRLPSISHNLVKSNENYAIILSLTNGFQVASYWIEINSDQRCFLLKNANQFFQVKSSYALGELLEKLLLKVFGKSDTNWCTPIDAT